MDRVKGLIRKALRPPIRKVKNEYISWVSFANAGMLNPGNTYCFDHVIQNLPTNDPIIEIGSFCGLSTNVINYFLRKYGRSNNMFACDKWEFEGSGDGYLGDSSISHKDYKKFVKESYMRNVSFFSRDKIPFTIEVFSDELFQLWEKQETVTDVFGRSVKLGGPISFSYIDGNHTYEFAKHDFENSDKYLVKGGFVLFDDSSDTAEFGSAQFAKELEKNPNYELVMKNPNYLYRKK